METQSFTEFSSVIHIFCKFASYFEKVTITAVPFSMVLAKCYLKSIVRSKKNPYHVWLRNSIVLQHCLRFFRFCLSNCDWDRELKLLRGGSVATVLFTLCVIQ